MKKRTGEPWMPAPDYARGLRGLTLNLIVREIEPALRFQRDVLGAEVIYSDPDFAAIRHGEAEWMLHADHTYDTHPLHARLGQPHPRGTGAELRLHGCDPDRAAEAARGCGFTVLAAPRDRPHGLREAFLLDGDGYIWVPDVLLGR